MGYRPKRRPRGTGELFAVLLVWVALEVIVIALEPAHSWSLWVEAVTIIGTAVIAVLLVDFWRYRTRSR